MGFLRKWWRRLTRSTTLKLAAGQAVAAGAAYLNGELSGEAAVVAAGMALMQVWARARTIEPLECKDADRRR